MEEVLHKIDYNTKVLLMGSVSQCQISNTFSFVYLEVDTRYYFTLLFFIQALLCLHTILPTFWHRIP